MKKMKKKITLMLIVCLMQSFISSATTYYISVISIQGQAVNGNCYLAEYYFYYKNAPLEPLTILPTPLVVNVGDILIFQSGISGVGIVYSASSSSGLPAPYQYVVNQPLIGFSIVTNSSVASMYCPSGNIFNSTVLYGTIDFQSITNSITTNSNETELSFGPNPIIDNLTIKATKNIGEAILTDVSGKIIFQKTIENTHTDIDFNFLENGLYFINVGGVTRKVIKQ